MNYIEEYIFTGFMPSGNPFDWYYDKNEQTAFTTSDDVKFWTKKPSIGDKVKFVRDKDRRDIEVYINGELVYKQTEDLLKKKQELSDRQYESLIADFKVKISKPEEA